MLINWTSIHWGHLILAHFSCVMLLLAIIFFIFDWILQKIRGLHNNDVLLRWLLLLPVGLTGIYASIMCLFFSALSATLMHWQTSPFQQEVGIAYLSLGILGIMSFRASYGFRLATVIAASIWMWGHALAQIIQIITTSNIYLGDAVSWFWVNLLLPFILIRCIRKAKPVVVIVESTPVIQPSEEL